jgi:hypothetical protein
VYRRSIGVPEMVVNGPGRSGDFAKRRIGHLALPAGLGRVPDWRGGRRFHEQ